MVALCTLAFPCGKNETWCRPFLFFSRRVNIREARGGSGGAIVADRHWRRWKKQSMGSGMGSASRVYLVCLRRGWQDERRKNPEMESAECGSNKCRRALQPGQANETGRVRQSIQDGRKPGTGSYQYKVQLPQSRVL